MPRNRPHTANQYKWRARLPKYLRVAALAAIGITIFVVVVAFYRESSTATFHLRGEHAQLSKDVIAEVSGYERLESVAGVNKYYIKADHAKTFSDDHQELENVYFEAYDETGNLSNRMTARSALYIPGENKDFTAYLKGDVRLDTADELKVTTNHIVYTHSSEIAEADENVEFEFKNVRGRSFGAIVRVAGKQIELLRDVELLSYDSPELAASGISYAKIKSGSAVFEQALGKVTFNENVAIAVSSRAENGGPERMTDITAGRAVALFGTDLQQITRFELWDGTHIVSDQAEQGSTVIDAGHASYYRAADRFELKGGTHIVSSSGESTTDIRASEAIFEQTALKLALTGGAEIVQGGSRLTSDSVTADLFPGNKIKEAVMRGNAAARQTTEDRTATVSAPELNVSFNISNQLENANAVGQSAIELIPADPSSYSRIDIAAMRGVGLFFREQGLIETVRTDGRTTLSLSPVRGRTDASNKRVIADHVKAYFAANGKDLTKAEAVGNAELYVDPLTAGAENYRTTIKAPRFDCEFFDTGNNAKRCVGAKKARVVRSPTVASAARSEQIFTADVLAAEFDRSSSNIQSLSGTGSAKFTEGDRNAIAREITFTETDKVVRLRGDEPTVWDSRARARAGEIDWDTKASRSAFRAGVSTTYYSRKQMKDATPFATGNKPVYVTANSAEFDHEAELAVFIKDARGWQDDNYVRGDRLVIDQANGRLLVEGNIKSQLYNLRSAKRSAIPVSASAASLFYDRDKRLLRYNGSVDIRQGTDRITAGTANVFLTDDNEVAKTIAENNVVISQPGRRAAGTWVQYVASDESVVMRGEPATVSDAKNGSTQSGQITFNMRENRVLSEARTADNVSGRTRSVYRTKPDQ